MLVESESISVADFEAGTGFSLKAEGACKGDVCIPLPEGVVTGGRVQVAAAARAMGLPLVRDDASGLTAVGPEAIGGRALTTAEAPPLVLPDLDGKPFDLATLRGQKIVVYAWAPY